MKRIIAALAASSLFLASTAVAQNATGNGNAGGKALGKGNGKALGKDRETRPGKASRGENAKAFGKGPRVCLLTFDDAEGTGPEDVIKAQYLPLGVAIAHKGRVSGDHQSIDTYGPEAASGTGIDRARLDPKEIDPEFEAADGDSTREVCTFLADLADEKNGDEDSEGEQDS